MDDLLENGRLAPKGKKYPTLWIPDKRVRPKASKRVKPPAATGLKAKLKDMRKREARRRRIRAYQIFNNDTLQRIVDEKPRTPDELLAIKGMGPARVKKYGGQILELVGYELGR